MYDETLNALTVASKAKSLFLSRSKLRYLLSAVLAGLYLGFGVFLATTIGSITHTYGPEYKIYMGLCFGIALSLVVMTNSELFTGNNMVMIAGVLTKNNQFSRLLEIFGWSYLGNLIGALLVATLFVYSGLENNGSGQFIVSLAQAKLALPVLSLFLRGMLCNILICLAILLSLKMKSESAKLMMIFWCLFAFVTTGFEHSIVNMIIFFAAALLSPQAVSFSGIVYSLLWVTLGNVAGGCLLGVSYYIMGRP